MLAVQSRAPPLSSAQPLPGSARTSHRRGPPQRSHNKPPHACTHPGQLLSCGRMLFYCLPQNLQIASPTVTYSVGQAGKRPWPAGKACWGGCVPAGGSTPSRHPLTSGVRGTRPAPACLSPPLCPWPASGPACWPTPAAASSSAYTPAQSPPGAKHGAMARLGAARQHEPVAGPVRRCEVCASPPAADPVSCGSAPGRQAADLEHDRVQHDAGCVQVAAAPSTQHEHQARSGSTIASQLLLLLLHWSKAGPGGRQAGNG